MSKPLTMKEYKASREPQEVLVDARILDMIRNIVDAYYITNEDVLENEERDRVKNRNRLPMVRKEYYYEN